MSIWESDKEPQAAWDYLSRMTTRAYDKADEKVKWIFTGLVAMTAWFLTQDKLDKALVHQAGNAVMAFGGCGALSVFLHNLGGRKRLAEARKADVAPPKVSLPDHPWLSGGLWVNAGSVFLLGLFCARALWAAGGR